MTYGEETITSNVYNDATNEFGQAQFMFDLKPKDGTTTLTKIELRVLEMVAVTDDNKDEEGNLRQPKFDYTYTINLDSVNAVEVSEN